MLGEFLHNHEDATQSGLRGLRTGCARTTRHVTGSPGGTWRKQGANTMQIAARAGCDHGSRRPRGKAPIHGRRRLQR